MEKIKEMQKAAYDIDRIIEKVKQVTEGFIFDKEYPQHLLLISLHGSIVEMIYSCNLMLKNGIATCMPIVARSMIEALSSMMIIANDKQNINNLVHKYYRQREAQARSLLDLALMEFDRTNLNRIINKCKDEISKINTTSTKIPTISRQIKNFLDPHFLVAYKMYCSDAHNDLMSLENRHLAKNPDNTYTVEVFKETELSECIHVIDVIISCLLISTITVSTNVTSRRKNKIKNALHKFRQFKTRYYPHNIQEYLISLDETTDKQPISSPQT